MAGSYSASREALEAWDFERETLDLVIYPVDGGDERVLAVRSWQPAPKSQG